MSSLSTKFLSLTRSGVALLSKAYLRLESIPNELLPLSEKLDSIKSSLLDLRNEFNKGISRGIRPSIKSQLMQIQLQLDDIDRARINGKFISEKIQDGQYHLASILNECYCLMYELSHRISD